LKGKIIVSEGEIGDLIQKLDTNRNGEIDYSEFLTATVAHQLVITEQNLETAFSLFDRVYIINLNNCEGWKWVYYFK
jgi:Ca2+-binding EF-hand superfamily protein